MRWKKHISAKIESEMVNDTMTSRSRRDLALAAAWVTVMSQQEARRSLEPYSL